MPRVCGVTLSVALVASSVAVDVAPARAAAPPRASTAAAPVKAPVVLSRPDFVSAGVTARSQGVRVEVESARSEMMSTFVNPDGTRTLEQHQAPIRIRQGRGWKDVDLTLERAADGSVRPKGHPFGLRLSGPSAAGGDSAGVTDGGRQVALGWPGRLPAPQLDGSVATYPEVAPGVDLRVEARRSGFEQSFVLKQRPVGAAAWRLPLRTRGLTARAEPDGSVSFVDAKGVLASRLPAASAWDAVIDPRSGDHPNVSPVALSVQQQGPGKAILTVRPDAAWLADPARVFPVTVDPTYAVLAAQQPSYDGFVQEGYSSDQSGSTELRAGTFDGSTVARSFLNFPAAPLHGLKVMSASLSLYEFYSYSCTLRELDAYDANPASTATNWASQPAVGALAGRLAVAKGYSSACAAGRISVPITATVDGWSRGSASTEALRLNAATETDPLGWKKFSSSETANDPYLSITYDRAPGAPAAPTVSPVASTYYTSDATPYFTSKASDADGNSVHYSVEVHSSTAVSSGTLKASCTSAYAASGGSAWCAPSTALPDNATFYVRSAAFDSYLSGPWSPWTTVKTALSAPPAPAVACPAPYSNGSWTDTAPTATVPCTVTVGGTGNNVATKALVSVDGGVETGYTPSAGKVTVSVSNRSGGHSIKARAQSASALISAPSSYTFGYGDAGLTSPTDQASSTDTFTVATYAPPPSSGAVTAQAFWRLAGSTGAGDGSSRGGSAGWNDTGVALPVGPTPNGGVGVNALWNSTSATAGIASDRVPVLLDVQVCFTYAVTGVVYCTWTSQPDSHTSVLRVPHAFGNGYPTASAGPGQVALFTGEFNTASTDVSVPGYSGTLSLSRSHSTYAGPSDVVTGVFGPGWTAQLDGTDAGAAGM